MTVDQFNPNQGITSVSLMSSITDSNTVRDVAPAKRFKVRVARPGEFMNLARHRRGAMAAKKKGLGYGSPAVRPYGSKRGTTVWLVASLHWRREHFR